MRPWAAGAGQGPAGCAPERLLALEAGLDWLAAQQAHQAAEIGALKAELQGRLSTPRPAPEPLQEASTPKELKEMAHHLQTFASAAQTFGANESRASEEAARLASSAIADMQRAMAGSCCGESAAPSAAAEVGPRSPRSRDPEVARVDATEAVMFVLPQTDEDLAQAQPLVDELGPLLESLQGEARVARQGSSSRDALLDAANVAASAVEAAERLLAAPGVGQRSHVREAGVPLPAGAASLLEQVESLCASVACDDETLMVGDRLRREASDRSGAPPRAHGSDAVAEVLGRLGDRERDRGALPVPVLAAERLEADAVDRQAAPEAKQELAPDELDRVALLDAQIASSHLALRRELVGVASGAQAAERLEADAGDGQAALEDLAASTRAALLEAKQELAAVRDELLDRVAEVASALLALRGEFVGVARRAQAAERLEADAGDRHAALEDLVASTRAALLEAKQELATVRDELLDRVAEIASSHLALRRELVGVASGTQEPHDAHVVHAQTLQADSGRLHLQHDRSEAVLEGVRSAAAAAGSRGRAAECPEADEELFAEVRELQRDLPVQVSKLWEAIEGISCASPEPGGSHVQEEIRNLWAAVHSLRASRAMEEMYTPETMSRAMLRARAIADSPEGAWSRAMLGLGTR